jgi:hypothetical protein
MLRAIDKFFIDNELVKGEDYQVSQLSKLKKGEFFKFKDRPTVYVYDGKPNSGRFAYYKADDINAWKDTPTDRYVRIGFTY